MDCSLSGSSGHGIFQARILSELPFPSPGDLHPGIEPVSPALSGELPLAPTGKLLLKAYFVSNTMLKKLLDLFLNYIN